LSFQEPWQFLFLSDKSKKSKRTGHQLYQFTLRNSVELSDIPCYLFRPDLLFRNDIKLLRGTHKEPALEKESFKACFFNSDILLKELSKNLDRGLKKPNFE
jgi:hypothetical protein